MLKRLLKTWIMISGIAIGCLTEAAIIPVFAYETVVDPNQSFYTYQEMIEDLLELQMLYNGLFEIRTIANTADEREILEVVVGNPDAETQVLVQASIHGREYINTWIAMRQIEELLRGYEYESYCNESYQKLLGQVCFHILPMVNPDGVSISQFGVNGIRSESLREQLQQIRRQDEAFANVPVGHADYWMLWKANGTGVDLNRNFDAGWYEYIGHAQPSSDAYKGKTPGSEPESAAILTLADQIAADCVIAYHSVGNLIYWDYGSQGEIYDKDQNLAEFAAEITGYKTESTLLNDTDAAGCSDYFVLQKNIPAITIENGKSDCPVPQGELDEIWMANVELLPAIAWLYNGEGNTQNWSRWSMNEWKPSDNWQDSAKSFYDSTIYQADVYEYMTLREAPDSGAAAISTIPAFSQMQIIEFTNSTMVKVITADGQVGYVNQEYLLRLGEPTQRAGHEKETQIISGTECCLTCDEYITLRDAPATEGNEIRKLYVGDTVIYEEQVNSEFCRVSTWEGEYGYVMSKYLLPMENQL